MKELKALKTIPTSRVSRSLVGFTVAALTGVNMVFWGVGIQDPAQLSIGLQPAAAQLAKAQDAWRQVYQRLPNFPKENQYVSKETGSQAVDNTLVSRLIRYHLYVKSRTPKYRLDWKLTLADYLGANEYLVESQYPGYESLRQSPMDGDRAAIGRLSRAQREALIDVLVSIFNPNNQETTTATPAPSASPKPSVTRPTDTTTLPKPGAADLLKR